MDTARTFAGHAGAQGEGNVTTMIESQTAKIPSGTYLSAAIAAMVGSAALMLVRTAQSRQLRRPVARRRSSSWVPTTSS
jgi:hypothetical protein